jgi:nucleoside-diphosphate-sugar epimerase
VTQLMPGETILVTGGAGYVGAVLVPRLLQRGYRVKVVDLYVFGDDVLDRVKDHPHLEQIRADIRDAPVLRQALGGVDAVIHLACVSNDPSCELDPALSESINFEAFEPLVRWSRDAGVRRFVFASSSSIYGVSDAPEVTEDHPLRPVSMYNILKGRCEEILFRYQAPEFTTVAARPGTLCGCSPRQRLDLTVNLLTAQAVERGHITVFGGNQQRPNLHIDDMVDLYILLLEAPAQAIAGEAFNVGRDNRTVADIARLVKATVEAELPARAPVTIETTASNDPRSYHISSEKLRRRLGFVPKRRIEDGMRDLIAALRAGDLPGALTSERYYNVKLMKRILPALLARQLPDAGAAETIGSRA